MHKNIEVILKIPLPISQKEDVLLWHFNKKGEYTIKSCYQMALKIKLPNEPNSSPCNSKWWNALWSLNLTEKWRICYGGQPKIFCQLLRIYRKESAYKIRSVRDLQECGNNQPCLIGVQSKKEIWIHPLSFLITKMPQTKTFSAPFKTCLPI